jgi:anti-sigma-K factor RskA
MTAHDWFIEHRTDYAARTLDPDDEATFRAHLERCEECRHEVDAIERELAWLPMGTAPVTPPPGFKRRIVEHVLGAPHRRSWAIPAAVAASLLFLVAGWYAGSRQAASMADQLAQARRRLVALEDTVSVVRQAAKVLQASIEMDGQQGGLVIFADSVTHRWNVVMHGLPPAPPNTRYQFWFITAEGMVPGVELKVEAGRPVMFTTGMPDRGGEVRGAALTLEPGAAGDGPPRGKELAHLML